MQPFIRQEIKIEKPPKYDEIIARFPAGAKPGVIFSWGNTVYNPSNVAIPHWIIVHESVHGVRQLEFFPAPASPRLLANGEALLPGDTESCVAAWWARYLTDPDFMFEEELLAHKAEYDAFCEFKHSRNERRLYLKGIAARLSGPLYGHAVPFEKARALIKEKMFDEAT